MKKRKIPAAFKLRDVFYCAECAHLRPLTNVPFHCTNVAKALDEQGGSGDYLLMEIMNIS